MKALINLLASFGFVCVLLLFLFVLTLLGTLEQAHTGLFEVQKKYFENFTYLIHDFGPLRVPLPGAGLVLALLSLNLFLGGLVRIRKSWRTAGVIVIHLGMALMLAAGLVKLQFSDEGHLTLFESQRSDDYVSYYLWEVAIFDAAQVAEVEEHLIPDADLTDLTEDRVGTFASAELPFTVSISHFSKNCRPLPKGPMWDAASPTVDGYALRELAPEVVAERNVAGLHLSVRDNESGDTAEGLLWGFENHPWLFESGGKTWAFSLRHKRYRMPFEIHLDDFTRELHPRTGIPKAFMSDVTKLEDGTQKKLRISMNEPLRHGGLVLFQSSWGPQGSQSDDRLFSVFSVVRNPSDYWPEYSCYVIGLGLLITFCTKLFFYVRGQVASRRRLEMGTS